MEHNSEYKTLEDELEYDTDSQEEPITISYKTSAASLEEICLDRRKQHIKGLRGMVIGIGQTVIGSVELGATIPFLYWSMRLISQKPDTLSMVLGSGLVVISYIIKKGFENLSEGVHYLADGIASRMIRAQVDEGVAYYVKGGYTNNPTWWDTRSGIKVKPFENASDFLFPNDPNEEAYMFVNGLRIMSSETTKGYKGFFRHNRYTTIVKADLKYHTLNLNIHHRNIQFIANIAPPANPAFYFMGKLSNKPDGYHLDLKDYGFALH